MKTGSFVTVSALLAALAAGPALADPPGHAGKHRRDQGREHVQTSHGHVSDCPPGLAKKSPRCVPPGLARNHDERRDRDDRHRYRVGEVFRAGDYVVIRDPDRYGWESNDNWRYYRDGDSVYRVDSSTRKVLAVLNLINAFAN